MIKLSAFSDEASSSIEGQIQALKKNNIGYTELRSIQGVSLVDFTIEQAKTYNNMFADNGIKVWSLGSPLGKVDINIDMNKYLDKVKYTCDLAHIFDTDKIRMFSFFNAYNEQNKVIDNLNLMLESANREGVKLYHENEKDVFGDIAQRVKIIMDNVKGMKFIYDPANYIQTGQDANTTLTMFHKKTDYFHIKDVIAKTGELVPAGYGDGQLQRLIDMIDDDKVLTIEPHLAVFDGYANIDNMKMINKFHYNSNMEAFDSAVQALKNLLINSGYTEKGQTFIK